MCVAVGSEVRLQRRVHLQPEVDLGVEGAPRLGAAPELCPDVLAYLLQIAPGHLALTDCAGQVEPGEQPSKGLDPLAPGQRRVP